MHVCIYVKYIYRYVHASVCESTATGDILAASGGPATAAHPAEAKKGQPHVVPPSIKPKTPKPKTLMP